MYIYFNDIYTCGRIYLFIWEFRVKQTIHCNILQFRCEMVNFVIGRWFEE